MADRILLTCALRGGHTAGLADRLLIPEGAIEHFIQTARHLEPGSGWLMPTVSPAEDRLVTDGQLLPVDPGLLKETSRLRKGLLIWQARLDALDAAQRLQLIRALDAWNTSLLVGHGISIYKNRSELVAYLNGLELLGIPRQLVSAVVCSPNDEMETGSPVDTLNALGLSEVKILTTAGPSQISIKFFRAPDPFAYSRTLFRGLHVLRVMLAASGTL